MLGTPPQDTLHRHLHISNACEHSWIMIIMVGSKMYNTEYDLKAIMYPAYDTPHKLCNIRGNWNTQQPRLPPNNTDRPMCQIPPHLAQVESRVTPSWIFVFSWGAKPAWGVVSAFITRFILLQWTLIRYLVYINKSALLASYYKFQSIIHVFKFNGHLAKPNGG